MIILTFLFVLTNAKAGWEEDVRLTDDEFVSLLPPTGIRSIAADEDYVHTVWYDNSNVAVNIFYKRSTNKGSNWEDTVWLTNDSIDCYSSGVSASGSLVVISYCRENLNDSEIYCRISKDYGKSWNNGIQITDDTTLSRYPDVSVFGDNIHIVWMDWRDDNSEVYYITSHDGGESWSIETRLTNNKESSYFPKVYSINETVHVVWQDNRSGEFEIYYMRSTDKGESWEQARPLTDGSNIKGVFPSITGSENNIYISWTANSEINMIRSTDSGSNWSDPSEITDKPYSSSKQTIDAEGNNLYLAWQYYDSGNSFIYFKSSSDAGLNWTKDTLITDNNFTVSERPSIAVDGGMAHLLWLDMRDTPDGEIYYKRNADINSSIYEDNHPDVQRFLLYPNPCSDVLNIKPDELFSGKFKIYSIAGQKITETDFKNDINISSLSPGVYYIVADSILLGFFTKM